MVDRETSGGKRHLTIREMPADNRPRERMEMLGAGALSDAELLAILLRTGSGGESALDPAHRLLFEQGGLVRLSRLPFSELCSVRGMGRAKACQLQAGFELALRLLPSRSADRLQVLEPADLAPQLILELGRLDHEVLRVVLLDAKLRVVRDVDLSGARCMGRPCAPGSCSRTPCATTPPLSCWPTTTRRETLPLR